VNIDSKGNNMNVTKFYRDIDRACWASLDDWQKKEYRAEAIHLRTVHRVSPHEAVTTIRRMVRIGAWK
jgi:hypothetical protein